MLKVVISGMKVSQQVPALPGQWTRVRGGINEARSEARADEFSAPNDHPTMIFDDRTITNRSKRIAQRSPVGQKESHNDRKVITKRHSS
jgi:hypothetical protein